MREIDAAGFSGVQNFPTVGLIDGTFRANLEETGMGFGLEVDMIRLAHELGLLTTPYAFNPDEAAAMAQAGADILIPHMGLTTKGTIGAHTALTLEESVKSVQAMHDAAKRVNPDILVLCHGGPIAEPADAQYILDHTEGIVGFYGAQHGTPAGRTGDHRPGAGVHAVEVPQDVEALSADGTSRGQSAVRPTIFVTMIALITSRRDDYANALRISSTYLAQSAIGSPGSSYSSTM